MLHLLRVEVRGVQGADTSGFHVFSTASHRRSHRVIRSDFAACAHMPEPGPSRGINARWAVCGVADSAGLVFLNGSARRRCGRQDARPRGEDGFRLPPRRPAVRRRPPSAAPPAQPHLGVSSALAPSRGPGNTKRSLGVAARGVSPSPSGGRRPAARRDWKHHHKAPCRTVNLRGRLMHRRTGCQSGAKAKPSPSHPSWSGIWPDARRRRSPAVRREPFSDRHAVTRHHHRVGRGS